MKKITQSAKSYSKAKKWVTKLLIGWLNKSHASPLQFDFYRHLLTWAANCVFYSEKVRLVP